MTKSILTIGFELASDNCHYQEFSSSVSLLDWDIILFDPDISDFISYSETYLGKRSLDDWQSFRLKECCEHWRAEIKQAVDVGKTVVVFLSDKQEVFVATGQKQYSGSGRNQKTTRIVAEYCNYSSIPFKLDAIAATGKAMKLVSPGAEVLSAYWGEFESISEYKVTLPADTKGRAILTKHGEKVVGVLLRSAVSSGSLLLLPDINFYQDEFLKTIDGKSEWTSAAKQFGARMVKAIIGLDGALRASTAVTPAPNWASSEKYALKTEASLRTQLLQIEKEIEKKQEQKNLLMGEIENVGKLRALLYEKGKSLEYAILDALKILGFNATQYKEADSEFDAVFECAEGRLLGEAEGKDNKAINVDKLRKLSMNINEDLQREEINVPAKGVLFGNGFRLIPPDSREVQFTQKCITAAMSASTALVSTTELFKAVQYLSICDDQTYAKICRDALLSGKGIVGMPDPPVGEELSDVTAQPDDTCREQIC